MSLTTEQQPSSLMVRLFKIARPHTRIFVLCLFLLLVNSLAKMLGPIVLQVSIDNYIIPGDFSGLLRLLLVYIVVLILGFIANYVQIIQLEIVGQHIIATLKKDAFEHLLKLALPFFDQSSTGKLVSRIENDANAMKVIFTSVITNILGNLMVVVGIFIIMAWKYDFKLALYIVGLCPLMLGAALLFRQFMSPRLILIRQTVAEVNGYLTEMIHGLTTVQVFGQQERVLGELEEHSEKKFKLDLGINLMFNGFFNFMFFIQTLGIVLVIWLGGKMVIENQMTIGSLILFISFINSFFVPIMFLSAEFNEFQKGAAGAERIFDLLDQAAPSELKSQDLSDSGFDCQIEFKGVWFRYLEDGDWILKDISFVCPPGEHWALVGPTGSGKTTLIQLLLKFYEPQQGQILLNGIDLQSLNRKQVRERIGLVLQDTILFPGSIEDNILLDTDAELPFDKVIQDIGLQPVLDKLPDGKLTEIKENAQNLSAGETQLISFARAMLKNPSILILDEATSHIDPETERKIQGAMENLLKGRTAFIIAHRLATIQNADHILVLKYGELVEQGNHTHLMKKEGVYAGLKTLQKSL